MYLITVLLFRINNWDIKLNCNTCFKKATLCYSMYLPVVVCCTVLPPLLFAGTGGKSRVSDLNSWPIRAPAAALQNGLFMWTHLYIKDGCQQIKVVMK